MIFYEKMMILLFYLLITVAILNSTSTQNIESGQRRSSKLENLVKLFSEPGAFSRVNEILGENSIEGSSSLSLSSASSSRCPTGDEGLDCRRSEARRSVDCPDGDCYCNNCALIGPDYWAPCCRESSKCCSHLAAACRNCDHPTLYSFCSNYFKKCVNEYYHLMSTTTATTTSKIILQS